MTADTRNIAVTKSITVRAGREHAFTLFTERFASWWPATHHIGEADLAEAIIEPRAGGRWYERGVDGSECDWGQVLAFDPPQRVLLSWHLDSEWRYEPDPAKASEVEVRFVAEAADRTRVELEHRHLERHDNADVVARGIGGDGGWSSLLTMYAERAAG